MPRFVNPLEKTTEILSKVGYIPSGRIFYPGMRVGELIKFSSGLGNMD
jgi:ABC-type multidrug transport system ATPase subunit